MRDRLLQLAHWLDSVLTAGAVDNAAAAVAMDQARAQAWAEALAELERSAAEQSGSPTHA